MNFRDLHRIPYLWGRVRDRYIRAMFQNSGNVRESSSAGRIRMAFIAVAFPLFAISSFFFILILAHPETEVHEKVGATVHLAARIQAAILDHRTVSLFLSLTFAILQLLAIIAALRSWESVLFAYVVITGIFGMIIGIVGISGLIISYLFMPHTSGIVTLITVCLVFTFMIVFYLLTVLGLKVMSHLRRHHGLGMSSRSRELFNNDDQGSFENISIGNENNSDQVSLRIMDIKDHHNYYI